MNYGLGVIGQDQLVWSPSAANRSKLDPVLGWDKLLAELEEWADRVDRADRLYGKKPKPIKPYTDLTGVHQQAPGKLTALYPVRRSSQGIVWRCSCDCGGSADVPAQKFRRTDKYAIRGCLNCVRASKREQGRHMNATAQTRREAEATDLGNEWGFAGFAEWWTECLDKLTDEQRLLFETICDGRMRRESDPWDDYDNYADEDAWSLGVEIHHVELTNGEHHWFKRWAPEPIVLADVPAYVYQVPMEALDIVLRCDDIEKELATFSEDRVERARQRIKLEGMTNETIH